MDYNSPYWGMHFFWWIFWIALLATIFFTPWGRSRRTTRSTLLHRLRRTYAEGKISTQEFEERKKVLEKEFLKRQEEGTATKG